MKVIIMRGIPGAGKDWWIKKNFPDAVICSADHYQVNEKGKYEFKPERAQDSHKQCYSKFFAKMYHRQASVLVVNNTNLHAWEISPYWNLAKLFTDEVEIVRVECSPEVAAGRNQHGVPAWKVGAMWQVLQTERLPPWWKEIRVKGDE